MDRNLSSVVNVFNRLGNVANKRSRFRSKLESKKEEKTGSIEEFKQVLRKPGLNSLAFWSKAFATKDRNTIKCFDPSLRPYLEVIRNELKDDEILMIISKKNLDFVFEHKIIANEIANEYKEKSQ